VPTETIRCTACGTVNDVTAFMCAGCGASLIGGSERWESARARDTALESDADRAAARARLVRGLAAIAAALVVVAVVAAFAANLFLRNFYLFGEPVYDHQPASYWVEVLRSDDHFMRRRAALAIESICDRFNTRTATEVVPSLKAALEDEDEIVRVRARSALDKIAAATGIT
jgi:hypothetical protein